MNSVLNALARAEQRKMAPVYFLEIYKVYKALYESSEDSHENKTLLKVKHILEDLYRND